MAWCGVRGTVFEGLVPERGQRLGLVGAGLVAVSAVTPWQGTATGLVVTPTGLRWVVLAVAFLAWVVVLYRRWSALDQLVVAACGAVVVGLTVERIAGSSGAGLGLYLGVFGALVLVVGGGLDYLTGAPE